MIVLAAVTWPACLFFTWIMATPMGFGMRWGDYSLAGQMFFLAPLIVLPVAGLVGVLKRRLAPAAATVLVAPLYQALYLGASSLLGAR
jgi:hypothetical protein